MDALLLLAVLAEAAAIIHLAASLRELRNNTERRLSALRGFLRRHNIEIPEEDLVGRPLPEPERLRALEDEIVFLSAARGGAEEADG